MLEFHLACQRGWEPGVAELAEASLVVSLLCLVRPQLRSHPVWQPLQAAIFRLADRFCCMDAKSKSPPVLRLAAARDVLQGGEAQLTSDDSTAGLTSRYSFMLATCMLLCVY